MKYELNDRFVFLLLSRFVAEAAKLSISAQRYKVLVGYNREVPVGYNREVLVGYNREVLVGYNREVLVGYNWEVLVRFEPNTFRFTGVCHMSTMCMGVRHVFWRGWARLIWVGFFILCPPYFPVCTLPTLDLGFWVGKNASLPSQITKCKTRIV